VLRLLSQFAEIQQKQMDQCNARQQVVFQRYLQIFTNFSRSLHHQITN
jgi:hypothetical protein